MNGKYLKESEPHQPSLAVYFCQLPAEGLATTELVAAFLQCSKAKLERDRWAGGGIPYIKNGHLVRYRKRDVLAYLENRTRTHTTQSAQGAKA